MQLLVTKFYSEDWLAQFSQECVNVVCSMPVATKFEETFFFDPWEQIPEVEINGKKYYLMDEMIKINSQKFYFNGLYI